MKNKTKKYIIIAVVIVAYIAVSVTVSVLLRKEQGALEPGVVMYGLSSGITDSVSYLSEDESVSPVFVGNGVNNSVYYTAPSLNTGCITESYTDDYTADSAPAMVIGEGHHKDNYTIVRVLNEQQVCVNQFLAFSPEVVGGVAVAAGDTVIGEKSVTLIATAAYEVLCDAAKTIRVFDCNGMLYMEITPEFYENAPYIIATGHFVENDSNEYLFVASSSVENGKIEAAVYSLSDGSVVKELSYDFGSEHNGKEVVMGVRNKENSSDSFIFLVLGEVIEEVEDDEDYEVPEYCDTHAVFEGNVSGGISQSDIMVPSYANGIYQSANEFEQYVITVDSELYSFIYTYTYGEKEGTKLNVDYEDSGFYWSVDDEYLDIIDLEDFEETYVRYTEVRNLNADEPEVQEETDDFMSHFTYWSVTLSEYNLYPARNAYRQLASAYEKNPSNIVAVELFSGSDILKDITADNNAKEVMESFKNYMISFYGSIENINEYFSTAFESEEDILSADMSSYRKSTFVPEVLYEYFQYDPEDYGERNIYNEWLKYNGYRATKRINRLYCEALAAGLPPEILSSNLELTDYIVSDEELEVDYENFVPTKSVVAEASLYSLNIPFGTNKKGIWYCGSRNAMALAKRSGFRSSSISSYSSESEDFDLAFYQQLYLLRNGCRYIGLDCSSLDITATELNGLELLAETAEPRNSSAYGSCVSVPVSYNGKSYNLVCMGDVLHCGVLKSVDENGKSEGSVYVTPVVTSIRTEILEISNNPRYEKAVHEFEELNPGSQIELTFTASYMGEDTAYVKIDVYNDGYLLEDACVTYTLTSEKEYYRYAISNQLDLESVTIEVEIVCDSYADFNAEDIFLTLEQSELVNPVLDDYSATAYYGGLSVDILDRDAIYRE